MLKFIENLREKSESDRKKILVIFVVLFMLSVFFLWVTNLDVIFPATSIDNNSAKVSAISPFKIFSDKMDYIKETISEQVNYIKSF